MSECLERLRASKVQCNQKHFTNGVKAGEVWAKHQAEFDELWRLADWDWDYFIGERNHSDMVAYDMFRKMHPEDHVLSRFSGAPIDTTREFWAKVLGENYLELIDDPRFLSGFAKGAVSVWQEVQVEV